MHLAPGERPTEREEAVGHGAQSGVVMEATPRAAFEVVQTDFSLHLLVVALDAPAQLGEAHQLLEGCVRRQRGEMELGKHLLVPGLFAQQPLLVAWGQAHGVLCAMRMRRERPRDI